TVKLLPMIRSILLAIMLASPSGLVVPVNFASQLVIPVAGSGAGANGTFFRSGITVINFDEAAQRVRLRWLPQAGGTVTETEVTIQGHGGLTSEDFVAAILGAQGLGSILVSGVSDSG